MRHQYPGNVRELENIVKRMVVLNDPTLERVPLTTAKATGRGGTSAQPGRRTSPSESDLTSSGSGGRT